MKILYTLPYNYSLTSKDLHEKVCLRGLYYWKVPVDATNASVSLILLQVVSLILVVCRQANEISFSSVRLITLFYVSSGHNQFNEKLENKIIHNFYYFVKFVCYKTA